MAAVGEVSVVAPDGSTVCSLTGTCTGAEAKRQIEAAAGVPPPYQRLLVGDREVRDVEAVPEGEGVIVTLVRVQPLWFVTAADDDRIRVVDCQSGSVQKEFSKPRANWAALSPDLGQVAIGFKKGACVLDLATEQPYKWPAWDKQGPPQAEILFGKNASCVAFSRDGALLLVAGHDKKARIVSMATGKTREVKHHDSLSMVLCACFSPDASLAATGMEDSVARVIDVATGSIALAIQHDSHVNSVSLSGAGHLATGCSDKATRIYDAAGALLQTFEHDNPVSAVNFNHDGSLLATGDHSRKARIIDVATGNVLHVLEHEATVFSVCFSPDGALLATGCQDGFARLFDAVSGELKREIPHGKAVRCVSFAGV